MDNSGAVKPRSVEEIAINASVKFFERNKCDVTCVSHMGGPEHAGFDLVIKYDDGRVETVEVKGTSNEWQIPDLYGSEVYEGRLIADFLVLVHIKNGQAVSLCKIPRDEFSHDEFKLKFGYRLSSKVKKEARLSKYIQEI